MKEKPSPLCPEDCNFKNLPGCSGCRHSRDVIFRNPEDVEVKFVKGLFRKAKIIGRADDILYVKEDGVNGIVTMNVDNKQIK